MTTTYLHWSRNISILSFLLLSFSLLSRASDPLPDTKVTSLYKVWFDYPKPFSKLPVGTNLNVKVSARSNSIVRSMTLYINGKVLSTDIQAPFRWDHHASKHTDLRNLKKGTYKLKVKIVDLTGNITYKECKFFVVQGGGKLGPEPARCDLGNPLQSLSWLRSYIQTHPRSQIDQYSKGVRTFFAIRPCHKLHIKQWYNCQGVLICSNACLVTRGARRIKTLYNGCELKVKGF